MTRSVRLVKPIGAPLAEDALGSFALAARAARRNLQHAVDFVVLHEDYEVDGPSPASSLNPPTVLAAVAAWERFIADITGLAHGHDWMGSGRYGNQLAGCYLVRPRRRDEEATRDQTLAGDAARVIVGLTGSAHVLDRLSVHVITGWSGATPRFAKKDGLGLRDHDYLRPRDEWESLTVGEAVYQSVKLRNAIAHSYLPAVVEQGLASAIESPQGKPEDAHWLNDPAQLFWLSTRVTVSASKQGAPEVCLHCSSS